jgi:hypothetical protein
MTRVLPGLGSTCVRWPVATSMHVHARVLDGAKLHERRRRSSKENEKSPQPVAGQRGERARGFGCSGSSRVSVAWAPSWRPSDRARPTARERASRVIARAHAAAAVGVGEGDRSAVPGSRRKRRVCSLPPVVAGENERVRARWRGRGRGARLRVIRELHERTERRGHAMQLRRVVRARRDDELVARGCQETTARGLNSVYGASARMSAAGTGGIRETCRCSFGVATSWPAPKARGAAEARPRLRAGGERGGRRSWRGAHGGLAVRTVE